MPEEGEDWSIRAEIVCCLEHALHDAARKISDVQAAMLREGLTEVWAGLIAGFLRAARHLLVLRPACTSSPMWGVCAMKAHCAPISAKCGIQARINWTGKTLSTVAD